MKTTVTAALVLAPLFLAGCSTSAEPAETGTDETTGVDAPPSVEPAVADPTTPAAEQDEVSPRGNTIAEIGDFGTLSPVAEPDFPLVKFAVTDITTDFACTSTYAEPPQNGRFMALTMDVETGPAPTFTEYLEQGFYISTYSFKFVTPEGTTANDVTGNAYMCLDEQSGLPSEIGPGEKATGLIVLDVPTTEGTVIYEDMASGEGWEWTVPAA